MSRDDEHGQPVRSRSNAELEQIAEHVAGAAGIDISAANILDVIADLAPRFKATFGLEIVEVIDEELPNREAEAQLVPPVIRVRESVLAAARRNDRRARMTFAHEFGHLILEHGGEARGRSIQTTAPVRAHEDAEHQAKYFAACLLMRPKHVQAVSSAKELAMLCGVSVQAAEFRFEDVFKRSKGRPTPPLVRQFLEARRPKQRQDAVRVRADRATSPQISAATDKQKEVVKEGAGFRRFKSALRPETEARLLWELAPTTDDPSDEFRCIDGLYIIRWSRWQMMQPAGWRVVGGRIVPWESDGSR